MVLLGKKDFKELVPETSATEKPLQAPHEIGPVLPVEKPVVEAAPQVSVEAGGEDQPQVPVEQISEAVAPVAGQAVSPPVVKDEMTKQIEEVLSEDLTDMFLKMDPKQQEAFREKGEETASQIRIILSSAKVGVKKILVLITEWLKMIPGVNKFFLEQEAKIKTDKILLNAEDFRKEGKL